MLIAITGTPGVGKTTTAKLLAEKLGYEYVSVKDLALEWGVGERVGEEVEIDVDALAERFEREFQGKNAVVDGHLSHLLPADIVVVLRLHPLEVAKRLGERGYDAKKLAENVEAELVDVCLVEALEEHENVIEVDTTGKNPEEVLGEVLELIKHGPKRRVGIVDWSNAYDDVLPYLTTGGE
ncbi:adenylate kinase family protein [Palaeococcus ferrophilus]|uniref:adenylate kinase family protein n=1 Tax=Palaeococcus ferrophilus TaxID=83868 RepID=UPI00064E7327|nr:adenylate kinase family protein [Palaeococcus ferrophilus]